MILSSIVCLFGPSLPTWSKFHDVCLNGSCYMDKLWSVVKHQWMKIRKNFWTNNVDNQLLKLLKHSNYIVLFHFGHCVCHVKSFIIDRSTYVVFCYSDKATQEHKRNQSTPKLRFYDLFTKDLPSDYQLSKDAASSVAYCPSITQLMGILDHDEAYDSIDFYLDVTDPENASPYALSYGCRSHQRIKFCRVCMCTLWIIVIVCIHNIFIL